MLDFIIPLLGSYFQSGIFEYILVFMVALAFLVCVPSFIRAVIHFYV